jgi:hypothetical protein
MIMKTQLLIVAVTAAMNVNAQWITSMSVYPPNPMEGNPVTLIAEVDFPSGTCNQKTLAFYQNGNDLLGSAMHCIGPLAYICGEADTFITPPLQAGNYRFIFHVDAGAAPAPCTPGIVAGPTDTLSFTVGSVTGLQDDQNENASILYSNNFIYIKNVLTSGTLYIYDATGRLVYLKENIAEHAIEFSDSGMFTAMFKSGVTELVHRFVKY